MKKIKTILIANRGEIACRVIRTAKKLGIKTIAIYSDLDEHALFAEMADVKVSLNGIFVKDTYSNIEKVVNIAKEWNVDAIHPGYGFLSENADFANILEKEKIGFIGPSAFSMSAMGDKLKAKLVASQAEVPMVPGCEELITSVEQAKKEAKRIGYPVMFKAVAGGGGKGIRIVYDEKDIKEQFEMARYEGKTIYKNDNILLEKYIENPRHIEIQIVADKYGNVVCLGERECSIQRFNQKVIEESPSSFVDDKTRQKMYDCAVKLVKQCKYYSVGTLEFVMDSNKNFYFLEMNTRLQVEHPVTEYVTNLDLVELMINIENGEKLSFKQKDIILRGHAIECRICAENPAKNFIPSNGKILHYIEPNISSDVRIETGVQLGDEISPYYDSMIAKLITYGNTRYEAIETMKRALGQYEIGGIETNIALLESIMRQDDFIRGDISTQFIKKTYPHGFNSLPLTDNTKKVFVMSAVALYTQEQEFEFSTHITSNMPRDTVLTDLYVTINEESYLVSIIECSDDYLEVSYNGKKIKIKFNYSRGAQVFRGIIDGKYDFSVRLKQINGTYIMQCSGISADIRVFEPNTYVLLKYMPKVVNSDRPQFLISPITGKIIKSKINNGDVVSFGQHLLSIEAMKMENNINAECCGKVAKIFYNINDNVRAGDKLIEFDYKDVITSKD